MLDDGCAHTLRGGTAAADAYGGQTVRARGSDFVDARGRTLSLRGVNLGGSSKLPFGPAGESRVLEGFFENMHSVSFVGRPFPLADADAHLNRLRAWGFNLIRLVITWEAVEHAGPGQYDAAYLEYLAELVERAGRYGLCVYVDPHQDVWSRFSGGDGAPGWTFAAVGLDVTAFEATGAALVHQTWKGGREPASFPRMCWPTNLHKLACATMFTLFWAGDAYAPRCVVGAESAQSFLQGHYSRAMAAVARALRHCPNVLGFGTMNEPLPGYVGVQRLDRLSGPLKNGLMPTPFEGMALGAGHALRVGRYALDSLLCLAAGRPVSTELVNAGRRSAWLPGHECVWKAHGVWADARAPGGGGKPTLLRPDYFAGRDFGHEFYLPFTKRFGEAVRAAGRADWLLFVELPPADLGLCKFPTIDVRALGGGVVHAPHWYDQLTLFLGRFVPFAAIDVQSGSPHFGAASVSRMRARQLAELLLQASTHVDGAPTLIGEVGIPFDMHDREAYGGSEVGAACSLANCAAALSATVDALESSHLSYTMWCYSADHTPEWGDGWNREDLSLYSTSAAAEVAPALDPHGVHLGGRALQAFVRPYVQALAGTLVGHPRYEQASGAYELRFRSAPREVSCAPTVVFVPELIQYPHGFRVAISDGSYSLDRRPLAEGGYTLLAYSPPADAALGRSEHWLRIAPTEPRGRSGSRASSAAPPAAAAASTAGRGVAAACVEALAWLLALCEPSAAPRAAESDWWYHVQLIDVVPSRTATAASAHGDQDHEGAAAARAERPQPSAAAEALSEAKFIEKSAANVAAAEIALYLAAGEKQK